MAPTTMTPTETIAAQPKSPILKVTRYDRVAASMIAIVVALIGSVIWLTVLWATNRLPTPQRAVPVELVELSGGVSRATRPLSLVGLFLVLTPRIRGSGSSVDRPFRG